MTVLDEGISKLAEQIDLNDSATSLKEEERQINDGTADFTVRCENAEWRCHRSVLSKCDFFKACFDGGFKEANDGVMVLEDDDPESIEVLLHYLYTGDTSTVHGTSLPVDDVFARNINVHSVANKYGIQSLKEKTRNNIRAEIRLVEIYLRPGYKRCPARSQALKEALRDIYDKETEESAVEEIKKLIIGAITNVPRLWHDCADLDELMSEFPALRRDILKSAAKALTILRKKIEDLLDINYELTMLS